MSNPSEFSIVIQNLPAIAVVYSDGIAGRVLREVWLAFEAALARSAWRSTEEAWGVTLRYHGEGVADIEAVEAAVLAVAECPVRVRALQVVVALEFGEGEAFDRRPVWPAREIELYRADMAAAVTAFNAVAMSGLVFAEQPVVSALDGTELYRERLVRLSDEAGELLSPGAYLPAIERLGLTRAFDCRVVRETVNRLRRCPGLVLGCNISALSTRPDLWWASILLDLKRDPQLARRLVIEITETAMLPDAAEALEFASLFRETGCRIAIDDFGAGLSLVAFARSARPDIIKIDAIFVRDAAEFILDRDTLASLISFSACLASHVVIEGIEDEDGLAAAKAAGAKWLQGYHFGRPSVPDELGARTMQQRLQSAISGAVRPAGIGDLSHGRA